MNKLDVWRYIAAGIITIIIFSLGLMLGMLIDIQRAEWAKSEISKQEVELLSLNLQNQILMNLETRSNSTCKALKVALTDAVVNLNKALDKFIKYKQEAQINPDKDNLIEREYAIANIRYWLIARNYKRYCQPADLVTILYFYSDNCERCPDQGVLLTYFKRLFGERLLVFPIHSDIKEQEHLISMLEVYYNITSYPSIVIEDKVYPGVFSRDLLKQLICNSFLQPQPECT